MKKIVLLALLLAAAAGGFLVWHRQRPGAPATPPVPAVSAPAAPAAGAPAPAFDLRDTSGNLVSSSRFAGRPLVLNFFATWCPPCRREIPGFVEVYRKYRNQGVEVVGIALDTDTRPNLPAFIMENRIDYQILLGDLSVARAYGGVSSIPTTFFVGRDGRIKKVHVGYLDRDAFEREVRALLL